MKSLYGQPVLKIVDILYVNVAVLCCGLCAAVARLRNVMEEVEESLYAFKEEKKQR